MPFRPATPIGPPETLVARVAATAADVADVQAAVRVPTGVQVDLTVAGDADPAVREAMAALIDHMLEATRHPVVATFLLTYRDRIGL